MTHLRGVKPALSTDTEALTKVPTAPRRLNKHARTEWRRVMPQIVARRIITTGDLAGIENYCIAVGMVEQIGETLNAMAIPDLKLAGLQIRYMQTARQLAAEYGLTPTSRARVGGVVTADKDDASNPNPLKIGRNRR